MGKVLEGVRVVEVAMWAYVPSAGAVLADWGADVIKVEHPTGDPIRGLVMAGIDPAQSGLAFMWEIFNRGKRSIGIELGTPQGRELLMKMVDRADVFLVSLLPAARRRLGIDLDQIRARNPRIIYATGSGQGPLGPDSEKGGYDSISFWSRSGIASAVTPLDTDVPIAMPGGAFGDGLSGALLAGGVAAALAKRERTGEVSDVDGSLLATGMWAMQPGIVGTSLIGAEEMPKGGRDAVANPLVNTYKTSDDRFVALCMLQADRYWPGFCQAAERPDLEADPRFATAGDRAAHAAECVGALDELFATHDLAEWRRILGSQGGQWDVLQKVAELREDPQALANRYVQTVDYGGGRTMPMVAAPVQFDQQSTDLAPAPELGAHTEEIMLELGMDWDEIINAKEQGAVT